MIYLSAVQMTSGLSIDDNLAVIDTQLAKLQSSAEHIVVLPECCLFFGGRDQQQLELAKSDQQTAQLTAALAGLAKQHQVYLIAGTFPILTADGQRFTNSCCCFSPGGELIGRYDKIHLFDAHVPTDASSPASKSPQSYRESNYTQAGRQPVTVNLMDITLGLTVCYDVRFPELYRQLTQFGAQVITVPSAFTAVTGKAHWQALLQARAIENQVYIVAAGQTGVHANGRETWGHSMIISPWGEILASLPEGEGIISAPFQLAEVSRVRSTMPVAEHNQYQVELKKS